MDYVLLHVSFPATVPADMSARAFYESVFVSDYVLRHLNLRDHPQVSLSDQDHSKVLEKCLFVVCWLCSDYGLPQYKVPEICW